MNTMVTIFQKEQLYSVMDGELLQTNPNFSILTFSCLGP